VCARDSSAAVADMLYMLDGVDERRSSLIGSGVAVGRALSSH